MTDTRGCWKTTKLHLFGLAISLIELGLSVRTVIGNGTPCAVNIPLKELLPALTHAFCAVVILLYNPPEVVLSLVAERALFLWNNDHIQTLIKQNHKIILPIVLPALEENARNHWNQAVQSLTMNVRKIFSDTDPAFYEECMHKFQEDEARGKDLKSKREATWKRLEEMAAMRVASNEPVLVSPRTASLSPSP
ncbi:hypothetical protein Lal_00040133 [Lupinus albus]|nr:hypothetical protein Lal_00040133 [Lupinus albus]